MKEPRHDDERLSALLAGRLEEPEREELLAYLSTADEDREVFASAAAILREMEEEDAQAGQAAGIQVADPPPRGELVPPSMTRKSTRRPRRTPRWAIPLALVGLVLLVVFPLVRGRGTPDLDPGALAAVLDYPAQGSPVGWDARPIGDNDAFRGTDSPARTRAAAARAGGYLARLAIAIQARDAAQTAALAADIKENFDRRGGHALDSIRARAGEPPADLQPLLRRATERLDDLLDAPDYLRLGAWTETARVAAAQHKAGFFRSDDTESMLRRADGLTRGDPEAQAALARVRTALADDVTDWTSLETSLRTLLAEIATEQQG